MKSISHLTTACLAILYYVGSGGGSVVVADEVEECDGWAKAGECSLNPKYMIENCPDACADQAERDKELAEQIGKLCCCFIDVYYSLILYGRDL